MNCLPSRQFTWNVKPYFLWKKKCFNMLSAAIVTSALCVNIIKIQRLCIDIFLVSPWKQVLWALVEGLLMSTHNVYFCGNITKIYTRYPRLSRAMLERGNWLEEECMEKERTRHVRKTKPQERLCTYACWSDLTASLKHQLFKTNDVVSKCIFKLWSLNMAKATHIFTAKIPANLILYLLE